MTIRETVINHALDNKASIDELVEFINEYFNKELDIQKGIDNFTDDELNEYWEYVINDPYYQE